ncbi:methyltransferase, FxLD system [Candidatus Protofrankia californiensis]|uniref:methyltransferase, FxLD system n=1 Tax=Candidatus Protofrankia californiensis TaxID=1839754 RepID=UPI0010415A2B|nr:methyltransferase, FxLD system [Candidatus Protofrankia californiensis]
MTATTDTQPEDLRNRMVDRIDAAGHLRSVSVERALRTVPRHLFVPNASIEDAYADKSITTKPGGPGGRPASCASVPTVVAMMLGQLDARPGDRVLEIGAGTGYNAALLAELVGETGQVTTIDIHPDVTEQARRALEATGYGRVRVLTGDGALGAPDQALFDHIIVTVGPWDLPPGWRDQLAPGGRLVVPLHWRGQARSVAFVHQDGVLRATDSQLCGFIPMIGDGQDGERTGQIADDVALYFDRDQPIDPAALHGILAQPATTVWSGASVVPNESTDLIWPRLTGAEPGTCRFAAEPAAEAGLCNPAFTYRSPALVDGDSLAYLTLRGPDPDATERRWELGAIGHGPAGTRLAERLCEQIRAWDRDRTAQPTITAYPAGTPDEDLADGVVIDKQFIRLVVSN